MRSRLKPYCKDRNRRRYRYLVGVKLPSIMGYEMRTDRFSASLAVLIGVAGAVLGVAGCRSLPPSKPEAQWTAEEARGAQEFHNACAKCHYPTTTSGLHGPGLQAITKIKAMPSGAPPTDERLAQVILHGHGTMPATQLSDDELHDLLAYLHSL